MVKKRITLSMDPKIYDQYRDYCEENGIILSKKVEIFIKKELENIKEEGKSN